MKCPHCQEEIPGMVCNDCGAEIPNDSRYCMNCGVFIEENSEIVSENDEALDIEDRVLCSDGTCTGIIINGKCSECGKSPEDRD